MIKSRSALNRWNARIEGLSQCREFRHGSELRRPYWINTAVTLGSPDRGKTAAKWFQDEAISLRSDRLSSRDRCEFATFSRSSAWLCATAGKDVVAVFRPELLFFSLAR